MTRSAFVRHWLSRPPALGRSLIGILISVGGASILRWVLGVAADPVPFSPYYPAIVLCALFAGWRAGLVCIVVSMATVDIFFLKPYLQPTKDSRTFAMMVIFLLSSGALVGIAQTLRTTLARLSEANERTRYLNDELLHRVRNTLAIINSLAIQTYRAEPLEFPSAFGKRMSALAGGLDILAREHGMGMDLRAIVETACKPFMHGDCIRIEGETCLLANDTVIPLTLAMHELCTNAVKYGALSVGEGKVRIECRQAESGEQMLLDWRECNGPKVDAPVRRGLGSALLRDARLGPALTDFRPDGFHCQMRLRRG